MTDAAFCESCGTDRDQYGSPDRRLFHRCASCRLEVCPDCWNRGRDVCLNCAPFSVGLAVPGGTPAAAGTSPVAAAVPGQAAGWTLVAPDDSPGVPAVTAPAAAAPAVVTTAAVFETPAASRVRLGDTLAAIRGRGIVGLGAVAGALGKPVRMATHAVLLLCLTTLGLLVTWQLVSFAGTARPLPGSVGSALGADPTATSSPSLGTVVVGASPPAVTPSAPDDRGSPGGAGGRPHGGPTAHPTTPPTSTPSGTPTSEPTSTPTAAPTPTDTPTAAPTDTPPPPPTDTPAPPTDTPAPPTDTPAP